MAPPLAVLSRVGACLAHKRPGAYRHHLPRHAAGVIGGEERGSLCRFCHGDRAT